VNIFVLLFISVIVYCLFGPKHICAVLLYPSPTLLCLSQAGTWMSNVICRVFLLMFSEWKWKVILRFTFVDICGIDDFHCLNIVFSWRHVIFIFNKTNYKLSNWWLINTYRFNIYRYRALWFDKSTETCLSLIRSYLDELLGVGTNIIVYPV
jgi:hypothetical protein